MDSKYLCAELTATCNALGYLENDKYFKEPDCLITLKDLIRYLKHDDDNHQIRRELGKTKVLCTDLLPMLKEYHDDKEILDVVLRLLVNLTNPAYLLYQEQLPQDKQSRNHYLELLSYLETYKIAFTEHVIWATLTQVLGAILKLDWEHRQEEDQLTVERVLILIRNILYISINPEIEMRTDDDVTIHDQVLWALHSSGMEDLLLYIANAKHEAQFCMHVVEIISLVFREQTPEQLASSGIARSLSEKEKDEQELLKIREKEKFKRMQNIKKFSGRHSNFGGTYVMKGVHGLSDKELICHKPLSESQSLSFDNEKRPKRKPKNRRPAEDFDVKRRSTLSIRLFLKEFCVEFLQTAYNVIMSTVKHNLVRSRTAAHDETYYLWAMKFFMEFNRHYKFQVELVSETMSIQSFHYVQTQMEHYQEMMTVEKKADQWGRRLHLAVKAYQELLYTLMMMEKSSDGGVQESCKVIKGNIFYVTEYRDSILQLLMTYDEARLPKSYLSDLVTTVHIFLKMLQVYCSKNSHLLVQKRKKQRRKKNKNKDKSNKNDQVPEKEKLEEMWNANVEALKNLLDKNEISTDDAIPFDSTLDSEIDQKPIAMYTIQKNLRNNKLDEALGLLRASRMLWPVDDIFGAADVQPEGELAVIREIHFADIPVPEGYVEKSEDLSSEVVEMQEEETDVEEEEMETIQISEQEFEFKNFIAKFAHPKVAMAYCKLLAKFETNSSFTNHCIVKMLHRIAWDCKMAGLFYQVSVFRVFQNILKHTSRHTSADIKELYKFSKYVLSKFFAVAAENRKVLVEVLFWKNKAEVYELEEGYGSYQQTKSKSLWTEEQDEELKRLHEEYKNIEEPGKDVVDLIMEHMIDDSKTRRQILAQLKSLDIINDAKSLKKRQSSSKLPKEWSEEEEDELRTLFAEFESSNDIVGSILERLTVKRPKNKVKDKLLELHLVSDRKQLRKKRAKDPNKRKKRNRKGENVLEGDEVEELMQRSSSSESQHSDEDDDEKAKKLPLNAAYDLLKQFCSNERKESIEWVQEELASVAEDTKDDDATATPLVPISPEQHSSMQDENFRNFLLTIGILPPRNEQESFWRIPESMVVGTMEKLSKVLKQALKNECSLDEFKNAIVPEDEPVMSREKALELLNQKRKKKIPVKVPMKKQKIKERVLQSSEDSSSDEETKRQNKSTGKKKDISKKLLDLDDSSSDDDDEQRIRNLEIDLNNEIASGEEHVKEPESNEPTEDGEDKILNVSGNQNGIEGLNNIGSSDDEPSIRKLDGNIANLDHDALSSTVTKSTANSDSEEEIFEKRSAKKRRVIDSDSE